MTTSYDRMQQNGQTASTLRGSNPALVDRELMFETDTRRWKIGPGNWLDLPYADNLYPGINPALGILHAGLSARNTTAANIVFTGSSTTFGAMASAPAFQYVNRLARHIQHAYPSAVGTEAAVVASTSATWGTVSTLPGVHVYNGGEGGTTSATYMTDAEAANIAGLNPVMVLHMVGANDYANGIDPAVYKSNVAGRITKLKSLQARTALHVLVQSYPRYDVTSTTYPWSAYRTALQQIADANPTTVLFVDLSDLYLDAGIPSTDPFGLMYTDHIHQYDDGHALMARLLADALHIPAPVKAGTVVASDTFGRPDTTTGIGWTETGQQWGAEAGAFKIASGRAAPVSAASTSLFDCGEVNVDVSVQLAWTATGNVAIGTGLTLNAADASNRLSLYVLNDWSTWNLSKFVAGTQTVLKTGSLGGATGNGTVHALRLVAAGGTLAPYIDGVLQSAGIYSLSATERGQFKSNTKVGLRTSGFDAAISFDNFLVRTI